MSHGPDEMFTTLLHVSFSQLDAEDFVKNLALFLRHYMPVSTLSLSTYENNTLTRLATYGDAELAGCPGRLVLDEDLLHRIRLDPHTKGQFEPRVMQGDTGEAYCEVFNKIHPKDTTCIYFPLKHLSELETSVYISICTMGAGKYTQEHLELCKQLSPSLSAAVSAILYRMEIESASGQSGDAMPSSSSSQHLRSEDSEAIETLDQYIASYIRKIITRTHGRISGPNGAAMLLGLPASTLWAKMRKLGIYTPNAKKRG